MNLKIHQATKCGYIEVPPGGIFDASYPNSKNRRGRVQGGGKICPTIQCSGELLLYEGIMADKQQQPQLPPELQGKKFRIRKLTPRECFRLMDVDDADIDKIQAYPYESLVEHPAYSKAERFAGMTEKEKRAAMKQSISNSAQYKLAGNSIVVGVLFHIFRKMFIETGPDYQPSAQLTLF